MADQEKDVVVEEAAEKVYTFSRPVLFDGEEHATLNLDFEKLTGTDVEVCLRQYRAEQKGSIGLTPETDKAYQAYIVAKAAGVHVGLIRAASAKDYTRLTLRAQNFLLL